MGEVRLAGLPHAAREHLARRHGELVDGAVEAEDESRDDQHGDDTTREPAPRPQPGVDEAVDENHLEGGARGVEDDGGELREHEERGGAPRQADGPPRGA